MSQKYSINLKIIACHLHMGTISHHISRCYDILLLDSFYLFFERLLHHISFTSQGTWYGLLFWFYWKCSIKTSYSTKNIFIISLQSFCDFSTCSLVIAWLEPGRKYSISLLLTVGLSVLFIFTLNYCLCLYIIFQAHQFLALNLYSIASFLHPGWQLFVLQLASLSVSFLPITLQFTLSMFSISISGMPYNVCPFPVTTKKVHFFVIMFPFYFTHA